jgi:hypothetical protein
MRETEGFPTKLKKVRKKSASDLSIFVGILRYGSAAKYTEYEASRRNRSSSMVNLRTTITRKARRRKQHSDLQHRLENISPHRIQHQFRLGEFETEPKINFKICSFFVQYHVGLRLKALDLKC